MGKMPDKFNALARYNGEKARGLVHTEEYQRRMEQLQEEYNEWLVEEWPRESHAQRKAERKEREASVSWWRRRKARGDDL